MLTYAHSDDSSHYFRYEEPCHNQVGIYDDAADTALSTTRHTGGDALYEEPIKRQVQIYDDSAYATVDVGMHPLSNVYADVSGC